MPTARQRDFDQADERINAKLIATYEASAKRLSAIMLHPPGRTETAQAFNQARAAVQLSQVRGEISRLKAEATHWTSTALSAAVQKGIKVADGQAITLAGGAKPPGVNVKGTLAPVIDHKAIEVLARDTVGDLHKAADSMGDNATRVLRKMAATGVSTAEVNTILSGGIIEGKPKEAIRELKEALEKVHGKVVTIIDKNGDPINFDTGYYAQLVATTKTRQAVCQARHERLAQRGMDVVIVVGRISKNFCTAYVGKAFSLSGRSDKYPPLSSLPGDGPPFHPNCSKSTAPFIDELAGEEELAAAAPDAHTSALLGSDDTTKLQKAFQNSNLGAAVKAREMKVAAEIRGG